MPAVLYAILIACAVLFLYFCAMMIIGYISQIRPTCARGYRAISVDGSKSITPTTPEDFVVPNKDFPICAPMGKCPNEGVKYAVLEDGSSLQNVCSTPGCQCTAFQHCPAYVNVVFRRFGADDRVSYFQVVDPQVQGKLQPPNLYSPPILLEQDDLCFISDEMRQSVWPKLASGDPCIRGTLAKLSTNQALLACVPTEFIDGDGVFDVQKYMDNYVFVRP